MRMIIVVPMDGSDLGNDALAPAMSLARMRDADIHLLHIDVTHPLLVETPEEAAALRASLDAAAAHVGRVVGRPARVVMLRDPLHRVVDYDTPTRGIAAAIRDYVQGSGASVVVMATHGRGVMGRLLLGSVADHLIRESPTPLLLVRRGAGASAAAGELPDFRRIVVPLDETNVAASALRPALSIFGTAGVTYTLLEGVTPFIGPMGLGIAGMQVWEGAAGWGGAAVTYLERVAAYLRAQGAEVTTRVAYMPSESMIAHEIAGEGADVVALATHARRGLSRMLHGSVTEGVLASSTGPVFVVGPHAAGGAVELRSSSSELSPA